MTKTTCFATGRAGRMATALALATFTLLAAGPAHATCGDVTGEGSVTATDALNVLKTAVGITVTLNCTDGETVCGDVTGEGSVTATDALNILKTAVGITVTLNCSGSGATTTTTTTIPTSLGLACTSAEVFVKLEGSDLDAGYTGLGHNGDLIEGPSITLRVKKTCSDTSAVCTLDSDCSGSATCDVVCHCDDPSNADCEATGPTNQKSCVSSLTDCTTAADCPGTETCESFFGAPLPLSSAGVPVCITTYFPVAITATANSQTGTGQAAITLRSRVHLGIVADQPCPRCGLRASCSNASYLSQSTCEAAGGTWTAGPSMGDTNTCEGGGNNGTACTVHGVSEIFGGVSRDCPPATNTNVSGTGLMIAMREVTTSTVSKAASLPCPAPWNSHITEGTGLCSDFGLTGNQTGCSAHSDCSRCKTSAGTLELSGGIPVACTSDADCDGTNTCAAYPDIPVSCGFQCHCGFCDDGDGPDTTYPCFEDSECSDMSSTATCEQGSGSDAQKAGNSCSFGQCGVESSEECHDTTQGECAIQKWLSCTSDSDCVDDDSCVIIQKPCFESVITRVGSASPLGKYCIDDTSVGSCTTDADCGVGSCVDDASEPVTAGLFCIPPTASSAVNSAGGITGPGAIAFSTVIIVCRCGDGDIGCDEGCDDSDTDSGDGCDENCDIETGYSCSGEPSACSQ